jgi:hypothetical protein
VTLVLDSGALIAIERNERSMWARLKAAEVARELPLTHGGVVGQVWRGGPRQARLARALQGVDVRPLDRALGRAAGELLARTRSSDVIDAAVVLLAADRDDVVTLDRRDFEVLVRAAGRHVELIRP